MILAFDLTDDFTFADAPEMVAEVCKERAADLVAFYRAQYMLDDDPESAEEYAQDGLYQPVADPAEFVVSEGHSLPGPDDDDHPGKLGEMFNASAWVADGQPSTWSDGTTQLVLRSSIDGYLSVSLFHSGKTWELEFGLD